MVSAGWREPRLSLKCCSRNLPAWSRTQILTFSLVCWCEGVDTCAGGDTSELDPPDRPHLLGWRELNKLDAELSLDLLPGVLGPDFGIGVLADEEDALLELELGVEVDVGPEFTGVFEVPADVSSRVAPLDFLLDFLLETLFLFNMSDRRIGWLGVSLLPPSSRLLCRKCSGNMLTKELPAMVHDLEVCGVGLLEDQDMLRELSELSARLML